ncbi:MAG TPA: glycosyltransferase family 2 protein [Terriglobia bacterium]|nr:glycosyltransferase family 2 protein [Terriglobia bacterium]
MDLSICILTHHQPALLPQCIECCFAEMKRSGITGEVILIDNASTDGSPQRAVARWPELRVLRNESNLSFAAANNGAIRASEGRYVLILNDDAMLQEGSLAKMLDKMESDGTMGIVGPKLLNLDGTPQADFTNLRFPTLRYIVTDVLRLNRLFAKHPVTRDLFTLQRDPDRSDEAEHLAAACFLARREALDQVGMFDEGFQFWYEDTDLCCRIKRAGWRLFYLEDARVVHHGSVSTVQWAASKRTPIFYKSLTRYFRKRFSFATCLALRILLSAGLIVKASVACLLHLFRSGSNPKYQSYISASFKALRVLVTEWN